MPAHLVKQPNGLYARFSTIVDDFTDYNMTREEAIEEMLPPHRWYIRQVDEFFADAEDGGKRWYEAIRTIHDIHGEDVARKREQVLTQPVSGEQNDVATNTNRGPQT